MICTLRNFVAIVIFNFLSFTHVIGADSKLAAEGNASSLVVRSDLSSLASQISSLMSTDRTAEMIRQNIEYRFGAKIFTEDSILLASYDLGSRDKSSKNFFIEIQFLKEQLDKMNSRICLIEGYNISTKDTFENELKILREQQTEVTKEFATLTQFKGDVSEQIRNIELRINFLNECIFKYASQSEALKIQLAYLEKIFEKMDRILEEQQKKLAVENKRIDQMFADQKIRMDEKSAEEKRNRDEINIRVLNIEAMLSTFSNFMDTAFVTSILGSCPLMLLKNFSNVLFVAKACAPFELIFKSIIISYCLYKLWRLACYVRANYPQLCGEIMRICKESWNKMRVLFVDEDILLLQAMINKDVNYMQDYLESGCDADHLIDKTPLLIYAINNSEEIANLLVQRNCDINKMAKYKSGNSLSALSYALLSENISLNFIENLLNQEEIDINKIAALKDIRGKNIFYNLSGIFNISFAEAMQQRISKEKLDYVFNYLLKKFGGNVLDFVLEGNTNLDVLKLFVSKGNAEITRSLIKKANDLRYPKEVIDYLTEICDLKAKFANDFNFQMQFDFINDIDMIEIADPKSKSKCIIC